MDRGNEQDEESGGIAEGAGDVDRAGVRMRAGVGGGEAAELAEAERGDQGDGGGEQESGGVQTELDDGGDEDQRGEDALHLAGEWAMPASWGSGESAEGREEWESPPKRRSRRWNSRKARRRSAREKSGQRVSVT